ncbi:aldose epimerase [Maribacter sp. 4U21]|uniref:aldose epimerase family protein n=1 Tax=Maribacter sp. 4U21 TaxID=1889779 RepID=UPI000C15155B|nr:aldose epimerase [Maribacter sp. 4U21]PIB29018.1 aldose epimerase [Maribacter sp. 4U21]
MTELNLGNQSVQIDKGELVGYVVTGHQFIHQKGSPGWRNADTEMFPIIGPTNEANFRVATPKGDAIQDQHGLLREMVYEEKHQATTKAVFEKRYKAHTPVKNSKFPVKSTEAQLKWPYDFRFQKSFELKEDGLEVVFTITGEVGMPFMLGYHPAFNLTTSNPVITTSERTVTLDEVMAVGSRAFQVADCEKILLKDEKSLEITTEGFGNFMLWTEVSNMVCIEPISFYPYAVPQNQLHLGFEELSAEPKNFKVLLKPL